MGEKEGLKADFSFLVKREDVLAVLLFGSRTRGEPTEKSDTDICVVAPGCNDRPGLLGEIYRNLDVYGKNYDVRVFEDLPLYIKIGVIESNEIIHAKDEYELYEYFYPFRKLWEDQLPRVKLTREELVSMF